MREIEEIEEIEDIREIEEFSKSLESYIENCAKEYIEKNSNEMREIEEREALYFNSIKTPTF